MSHIKYVYCLFPVHDFTQVTHQRVFTDADVRIPATTDKINQAVVKAYEKARNANIPLDLLVELGLELMMRDGKEMWGYYFVDHKRRVIFWFEDYESSDLMKNIRGVESKSHVSKFFSWNMLVSNSCNCVALRVCITFSVLVRMTFRCTHVPSLNQSKCAHTLL
jgi:hypothetical protein